MNNCIKEIMFKLGFCQHKCGHIGSGWNTVFDQDYPSLCKYVCHGYLKRITSCRLRKWLFKIMNLLKHDFNIYMTNKQQNVMLSALQHLPGKLLKRFSFIIICQASTKYNRILEYTRVSGFPPPCMITEHDYGWNTCNYHILWSSNL